MSDYVLMEGRGFGFVTYKDPANAQQFLEVRRSPVMTSEQSCGCGCDECFVDADSRAFQKSNLSTALRPCLGCFAAKGTCD